MVAAKLIINMSKKFTYFFALFVVSLSASEKGIHILREDILATVCLDYKSQNKSHCGSSLYNCRIIGHSHKLDAYSLITKNLPATLLETASRFEVDTIKKEDSYIELRGRFNKKIEGSRTIICSPGMTSKENYVTYDTISVVIDNEGKFFQRRTKALFESDQGLGYSSDWFYIHILNEQKPFGIYSLMLTEQQLEQIIQASVVVPIEKQSAEPVIPVVEELLIPKPIIWVDLGVAGLGVIY